MFRNLILPAITAGLLLLVVHNPVFGHDSLQKKILAVAVIVVPALIVRALVAVAMARRPKKAARPSSPYTTARR